MSLGCSCSVGSKSVGQLPALHRRCKGSLGNGTNFQFYPEASVEFLPLCTAGSEACGGCESVQECCWQGLIVVLLQPKQTCTLVGDDLRSYPRSRKSYSHHVAIGLPLVGGFVKSASTKQSPSNTLCTVREEECTKHNSAKQPPKLSRNSLERK